MEPQRITDEHKASLVNADIVNFQAPQGAEDSVHAVSALFEIGVPHRFGPDRIYIPLKPDELELERLVRGEPLWLVFVGHRMPVFQTYVQPLPAWPHVAIVGGPHDGKFVSYDDVKGVDVITVEGIPYSYENGALIYQGPDWQVPLTEVNGTNPGPEEPAS